MAGIQDSMPTLWHFKIREPEIEPDDDLKDDIRYSLKKLSKLVELDTFEANIENGRAVVKVVRLQKSEIAIQQSNTLEDGIKQLCEAMVDGDSKNRRQMELLSKRSFLGIEPASSVFRTYWTASFFNAILAQGSELIDQAPFRDLGQDKPYLAPVALVFTVAALGGIFDVFRMFQQLYNKPPTSVEEVQRTIKESIPTVESWLNWLSESEASENEIEAGTQYKQKLEERRRRYKKDLKQFTDTFDIFLENYKNIPAPLTNDGAVDLRCDVWTYTACSDLCDMMTLASPLLRNNKMLVEARKQELTQAVQSGIFSAVSASMVCLNGASVAAVDTAAASATAVSVTGSPLAPIFFIGVTSIFSALVALNSFNKSQELDADCKRLKDVFEAIVSSATGALNVTILARKLQHGRTKLSSPLTDKDSQDRWEQAMIGFDRMSLEKNEGCSEFELLMMYVNDGAIALQKQREKLIV
ncbi:unnamed protein product [Clonostachys rhizophaga]|uniref:Uncharacterized protein n=1 Tax=Clonostachys rhizophaga TaxID=160324 RepID=A0A9N9V6F5_9HYPO|nr:unnamed protein product [Clonostachys rhizophaga]